MADVHYAITNWYLPTLIYLCLTTSRANLIILYWALVRSGFYAKAFKFIYIRCFKKFNFSLFYLRKESLTMMVINSTNINKTNNHMSYQLNRAKRCLSNYSLWWQSDSPIPCQTMVTFSFPVTCLSHTISGLSMYSMWAPATSNLNKQIVCIELRWSEL